MVWLPQGLVAVKEFASVDGFHRVAIFRRQNGLFGYAQERLVKEADTTYWEPSGESGIYETAEAAEQSARSEIAWLREKNSN